MKRKAKPKRPRKQSSSRVSSLAAKWLGRMEPYIPEAFVLETDGLRIRDLRALCASVLSQDETKGQKR